MTASANPNKAHWDVLDLGCGDGTTAPPAAELGADVLGVDIASNLVAAGNARVQARGLEALFEEKNTTADGTSIPATFLRVTVSV